MASIIQVRRDTATNWTTENPTLANGEMGYETDTQQLKFGDGVTAWTSLAYFATAPDLTGYVTASGTPLAGQTVEWTDADTIEDAGFATSDIGRLSQANTWTQAQTITHGSFGNFLKMDRTAHASISHVYDITPGFGGTSEYVAIRNATDSINLMTWSHDRLVGINESQATAMLHVNARDVTTVCMIVNGFSGQTADIARFQVGGVNKISVDQRGAMSLTSTYAAHDQIVVTNTSPGTSARAGITMVGDGVSGFLTARSDSSTYVPGQFQIASSGGAIAFNAGNGTSADVTILENGKVGIGNVAPKSLLDVGTISVASRVGSLMVQSYTDHIALHLEENSGGESWQLGVDASGDLNFHDSGAVTPSIVFQDGGNVGIGTASPSARLHAQTDSASEVGFRVDAAAGRTASAFEVRDNGTLVASLLYSSFDNQILRAEGRDFGSGQGTYIYLKSNTNATYPSAAHLLIQQMDTGLSYIWPDTNGVLRISGTAPSFAAAGAGYDTSGDAVGDYLLSQANTWTGNPTTFGYSRPIVIASGLVTMTASAGAWAMGYYFNGSSDTGLGGFGAYGSNDTLIHHWIGASHANPGLIVNSGNLVGINETAPSAQLHVTANSTSIPTAILESKSGATTSNTEWHYNGSNRANMTTKSTFTNFRLEPIDAGSSQGPYVSIGNNTDTTYKSPGFLLVYRATGAYTTIFPDDSSNWRTLGGSVPTSTNYATAQLVGEQPSRRETKNIIGDAMAPDDALAIIADTPVYEFTYKSDTSDKPQIYYGITTDDSPLFGWDEGRAFNPVNANGILIQAYKALLQRVEQLESQVKGQ